jgi:hypothetical protein
MATESNIKAASSGDLAHVTSENRLSSLAVSVRESEINVRVHKQGYVISVAKTPTGAGDYFFHIANGSSDDLIIDRILLKNAAAETFSLQSVTGTPANALSLLVPVNLYAGSTNLMAAKSGVPYHSVDITGLTPVATLDTWLSTNGVQDTRDYQTGLPVVCGPGAALALMAGTGTAALTALIYCHYAMEPISE